MRRALAEGGDRFGMRVCEFSVQGNHVHFIVEAENEIALSRGMQGFGTRMAKGLNGMMGRTGRVLADRFHARILCTPTEVTRALRYVRHNRSVHRARWSKGFKGKKSRQDALRTTRVQQGTSVRRRVECDRAHERERTEHAVESRSRPIDTDPFSSASADHGISLPEARTYLLSRAQTQTM
jgi:REP element-mobilizing transposase RayT